MRLSTERDRDESRAIAVLHAALDGGVTFLDTADAYCLDDTDAGHNERLIARALDGWGGDRSRIVIATKGGLTRPAGEWAADGRGRHLQAACEASLRALGVTRIQLYQLHAPDPRTPLATSVRALASLKKRALVEQVGLCNVTVAQIEEARRIVDVATVQVELSPWRDANVLNGVVPYCIANGIRLIAYRPLGGSRHVRRSYSNHVLAEVATRHQATPAEIVLAWLEDLSDSIVAIPGPTRIETAESVIRARRVQLTDEDRARLDTEFEWGQTVRSATRQGGVAARSVSSYTAAPRRDGEVVLVMGLPGAGKSTVARTFVEQGYTRLNRDEAGGTLRALVPRLEQVIDNGSTRIVLDNTYVSRASRALVVQAAARFGLPVRCVWLATGVEAAQVNAAWRIVSNHGRLPGPDEMRKIRKHDISAFPPGVQFRYQRELEPPDLSEGFSEIETIPFERTHDPSMNRTALIVWCDDVLMRSRSGRRAPSSADDVEVRQERGELLRRYQRDGWLLLGLSWRPEIEEGTLTLEQVDAGFARMQELLEVSMDILYCTHGAGPPVCWCRKPLPGLGVVCIQRHRLNPSRSVYVGAGPQDPGFARRLGFEYRNADDFFA